MKVTTRIEATADHILTMLILNQENCGISGAQAILNNAKITYYIGNKGDVDKGTFEEFLESLEIEY